MEGQSWSLSRNVLTFRWIEQGKQQYGSMCSIFCHISQLEPHFICCARAITHPANNQ